MKPKAPKTPNAKESQILELYALAKAGKWDDVLSAMGEDRQLAVSCSRHVKPGSGWTFLHQAAYAGHALAARALIGLGANVEARGADGLIPMDVALSRGFEELATTLRGANAGGLWTPSPDESSSRAATGGTFRNRDAPSSPSRSPTEAQSSPSPPARGTTSTSSSA